MDQENRIHEMVNRLARLNAAEGWREDINPTQVAVLGYLDRANRFSRSPSHVGDYLGTTRGTVSQTLKSLTLKGYMKEERSTVDRRVIHYDLTSKGMATIKSDWLTDEYLKSVSKERIDELEGTLQSLLHSIHQANNSRLFGVCCDCRYFRAFQNGGFCSLLSESLTELESREICHKQVPDDEQD